MGKKKQDEGQRRIEFWSDQVSECRDSGLSYAEYASRHGLKESAFGYWGKKLSGESTERPTFVQLKVSTGEKTGIEIILQNDIRIAVGADFDAAMLKKLIGVLQPL